MEFAKRIQGIESSFVRDILKLATQKDIISFAGGLPEADLFPTGRFAKAAQEILTNPKTAKVALQYGESTGFTPLKEIIAKTYKIKDNLDIDPNLIIITTGSQQALDLIGKTLLNEGDEVLLERPTYLAAIQALQFYKPKFTEIELSSNGPKTLPNKSKAKLAYIIPNFQNPTGITWSNEKREEFAKWAKKHNILIVEDDPYGEIRFSGKRQKPLKTFNENTVLLGSFSKILAPGLRLGWIIAPNKKIFHALSLAKQSADLHSSQFTQLIAAKFYEDFDAQAHIEKIAKEYGKRKDILYSKLQEIFPTAQITNPDGGMFLWVRFPEEIKVLPLLKQAIDEGVAFVPGVPFYVSDPEKNTARFNFSNTDESAICKGVARLQKAVKSFV